MQGEHYPVVEVSAPPEALEPMGSREKFWVTIQNRESQWLFKLPRPNTGEHWAEKIAAEIGSLIGVNCAHVDLARCIGQSALLPPPFSINTGQVDKYVGQVGTICESFQPIPYINFNPDETICDLWHGSEILSLAVGNYQPHLRFGQREHNVKNIVAAWQEITITRRIRPMPFWDVELEKLMSYALLDGLIGNTDRHHENWMLIFVLDNSESPILFPEFTVEVLPSFDHASSLGRELSDERRLQIMDSSSMLHYLHRGRGGVYVDSNRQHSPSALRLAQLLCRWKPEFAEKTLNDIEAVPSTTFRSVIDKVPPDFMSDTAKEFAYQAVTTSKTELMRSGR